MGQLPRWVISVPNITGARQEHAHKPGIQIADVQELLEHGVEGSRCSPRGRAECLHVPRDTLDFLKEWQIAVHVLPTQHAVGALQQARANWSPVGGPIPYDVLMTSCQNFLVGRVTPVRARMVRMIRRAEDCPPYPFAFAAVRRVLATLRAMDLPVRKKLPHTIPQWVADGSWFFITINCVPTGQKPTVPRRHWQCRARGREIQPREMRLALPAVPAYAGSSACDYCVPARPGNGNDGQELEEVRRRKTSMWIGNAISSTTACATIMNWKRKPATS